MRNMELGQQGFELPHCYTYSPLKTPTFTELQYFSSMFQQINNANVRVFERLKKMIVKEYQSANDSQIKRDREEFHYLHKKLEHIKKLVHDYDTEHPKQRPGQLIKW